MNELSSVPISVEFKDQRPGLVAFGIVAVVLGGLCALVPLLGSVFVLLASRTGAGLQWKIMVPGMVIYAIFSMILVWLGIGSILCRRWARALLLIVSWGVLLGGVNGICFYAIFSRTILPAGGAGAQAASIVIAVTEAFMAIFTVFLPGAMVLFYSRRHVKATCEAHDPVIRWTDTCPLPVLAASLWFGVTALGMLAMPLTRGSVMPLFGILVAGTKSTVMVLAACALLLYLAWATYRLKIAGWWTALAALVLFYVSAMVTFMKVDLMEVYRGFGYPEAQIDQIRRSLGSLLTGKTLMWWTIPYLLLSCIYLLWIKKYFRPAVDPGAATPTTL